MSALGDLHNLYPGHHDPEVFLFRRDPALGGITNTSFSPKLKNTSNPATVSSKECLHIADGTVPSGALRLFRFTAREPWEGRQSQSRLSETDTLIKLFEKLKFPLSSIVLARKTPRVEFGRMLGHHGDDDERPLFSVAGSRLCLVWASDLLTRSTVGVMVNFVPDMHRQTDMSALLGPLLQSYAGCFEHPMLLALVCVHYVQADTMASYAPDSQALRQIEHRVNVDSTSRIDTMQKLRDLGRTAIKDRYVLLVLKQLAQYCLDVTRELEEHSQNPDDKRIRIVGKIFNRHVQQRIRMLELDNGYLESISASVTNQQTSLSMIINMQDGTSIITMAAITILFLPGTFVASFFAMPMFEWDRELGRIISRQFWLYWAVVVPLTSSVVLIWLGWWYWHTRSRDKTRTKSKATSRLEPLHSDKLRQFEDEFYDFEHDFGQRDGEAHRAMINKLGTADKQESV